MPPSKYTRELSFIDVEVTRLRKILKGMAETMPADPAEAAKKAADATAMEEKIAQLLSRKQEIEQSFVDTGLEIPNIDRNMNATVHNGGAFEVHTIEEVESIANAFRNPDDRTPVNRADGSEGITAQIMSINKELNDVENRIMMADIEGDIEQKEKYEMMAATLRSRRETLVEEAKQLKAEEEAAANKVAPITAGAVDEKTLERIDSLEADTRAIRSQIGSVRSDVQDMKDQLRQILELLGKNDLDD